MAQASHSRLTSGTLAAHDEGLPDRAQSLDGAIPVPSSSGLEWDGDETGVLELRKASLTDPIARDFCLLLALCHSVVPEKVDEASGAFVYQAASPDDLALVEAARNAGYVFVSKDDDTITVVGPHGPEKYVVMAFLRWSGHCRNSRLILP